MARITLEGVAHSYSEGARDGAWAVKPTDLSWENGGAYALLGPSGCGKTTLLKIISGLLVPTRGRVLFDGRDVTSLSPRERNIAQVFQFPVLYDTMTVFENLAFPLRNRGVAEREVQTRVAEVAAILELGADLSRRAAGLSADAKQKISLGRGLVRKDVAAILLDEPLTVIDPHLKWLLRRKLKQVHEQLGLTLIYVTHDQTEALTLADRVVVMHEGAVVQEGSPQELFEEPAHTFVGWFIGSPGMNLLPCTLEGGAAILEGGQALPIDPTIAARAGIQPAGALQVGVRPEFVRRVAEGSAGALPATIAGIEDRGTHRILDARIGASSIKVKQADSEAAVASGDHVWLEFPPARTRLYRDGKAV